jgi:hypothetical protein
VRRFLVWVWGPMPTHGACPFAVPSFDHILGRLRVSRVCLSLRERAPRLVALLAPLARLARASRRGFVASVAIATRRFLLPNPMAPVAAESRARRLLVREGSAVVWLRSRRD